MSRPVSIEFGYYPERIELAVGGLAITTLGDLDESRARVGASDRTQNGWIYAPPGERIFVMPKTHLLLHNQPDGAEHLEFLVWALSFFAGMRLTATEAGFVDATPTKGHALVDFARLSWGEYGRALLAAEAYWVAHRAEPKTTKRWAAAVHAMFLAQYPRALMYERVIYLYAALDACYRMAAEEAGMVKDLGHPKRIPWMCGQFGMPVPVWAEHIQNLGSEITGIRAEAVHEALFMGEPLGFALHDRRSAQNLPLEMAHLVSRFLVALLGMRTWAYIRSPVSTYMTQGLDI